VCMFARVCAPSLVIYVLLIFLMCACVICVCECEDVLVFAPL